MQKPSKAFAYIRVGSEKQLSDTKSIKNAIRVFSIKECKDKDLRKGLPCQNKVRSKKQSM